MDSKKLITRPKEYQVAVCLNLNLLPAFPRPWQTVPSPVPSHHRVASHRCPFLRRKGAGRRSVSGKGVKLVRSTSSRSIGRSKVVPWTRTSATVSIHAHAWRLRSSEVAEAGSRPEVVLHVLDAAFNTTLGLSPIRTTKLNLDSQSKSKIEELAVPHRRTPAVPAQHHKFGIVVKALFGGSRQIWRRH